MTASDYKGSEINISDSNDGREGYLEVDKTAGDSFISYQDVDTAQKMKFSINYFFSKCDQIGSFPRKSFMEKFIFCAMGTTNVIFSLIQSQEN